MISEVKADRCTVFTDYDSYLFHEGTHYELYRKLGAHPDREDGVEGTRFLVWAPHAIYASVITAKHAGKTKNGCIAADGITGCGNVFFPVSDRETPTAM